MNLQFGTDFKSGSGKCTSGINGYIMNFEENFGEFEKRILNRWKREMKNNNLEISIPILDNMETVQNTEPMRFDSISNIERMSKKFDFSEIEDGRKYILFLDSQGMLSTEQRDKDFDRKIGTFLLAVSQMLLVNFEGELNYNFKSLLEITNYTYMSLNLGKKSLFRRKEATEGVEKGSFHYNVKLICRYSKGCLYQ
jgi:hypothetical protein